MLTKPLFLAMALAASPALAESHGFLLVTNKGDKAMSIVDPQTNQQVASVPEEGNTGHELIASADGQRAFVPIYGDSGVGKPGTDGQIMQVIDLAEKKIVKTLDFGHGIRPHCPILNRATGLLYVTTELDQTVTVIDPQEVKIIGTVPTGSPESHMLCVTKDGKRGYTANVATGTVSVLDLEKRKLLQQIPIAKHTQRIALSIDDKLVFTADQTKPQLAVIDTAANEVKTWIPLPDFGYGTAPTPDGKYLLVCVPNLNEVEVVDLAQMKVIKSFSVPRAPQEVLVRPDGLVAYASCDKSKQVAALDLTDWKVAALIDTGAGADGLAWAEAK